MAPVPFRTILRRAVRWMAFAALLAPRNAAAAPEGVHLLAAAPTSIRVAVDVPDLKTDAIADIPGLTRIAVTGFDIVGPRDEPGLPARTIVVAVPPTGAVRVRGTGLDPEVSDGLVLATAALGDPPRSPREVAAPGATLPAPHFERPARPVTALAQRARLVEVSWLRNQRVAKIELVAADYDLAAHRLTLYHRLEVEVDVEPPRTAPGPPAEVNDPFEPVYRSVLANYEQGRAWRRTASARGARGRRIATPLQAVPEAMTLAQVPDTSVFAGRRWVKIAIHQTGFYKVEFGQVRNTALFNGDTTVALDSLRLFTLPGFPYLRENDYCDSCDYKEVAIKFVDVFNNTTFGNNKDYFYFFALGSSDWEDLFDPTLPDTTFLNHPYDATNYYYLTIGTPEAPVTGAPARIAEVSGAPTDSTGVEVHPLTFEARLHAEEDHEYLQNPSPKAAFQDLFWEKWFWRSLIMGGAGLQTSFAAPGVDPAGAARIVFRAWGITYGFNRSSSARDHYLDVTLNGSLFPRLGFDYLTGATLTAPVTNLLPSGNVLTAVVPTFVDPNPSYVNQRNDQSAVAWFDIFYPRRFEPVANELVFDSPGGGSFMYVLEPFTLDPATSLPRVFDTTDPLHPVEVKNLDYQAAGAGVWRLRFRAVETGPRHYRVIPDATTQSRIVKVAATDVFDAPASSLENLRGDRTVDGQPRTADYLLIYYDGFRSAADTLATWRRDHLSLSGRTPPYDVLTVPISALYDQFSGGRTDPGAIRKFLRAAFNNWTRPPAYVTLLGDASYDFKNYFGLAGSGQPGALVPSFEDGFDQSLGRQYSTDDWSFDVDGSSTGTPDFFGGRIPVNDPTSALNYLSKLLRYERSPPLGDWHNRVMLIADDNFQGASPDRLSWAHVCQTTVLDSVIPPHIDRSYVYLHTYPTTTGFTKNGARSDILRFIDQGVLLFNYIGHGSPFKIADEGVLLVSDADNFSNVVRPAVFVAASCDVGKFDDPKIPSLGEKLVTNPNGGCIAVISATEEAFSIQNALLNKELYRCLFERDTTTASPDFGHYRHAIGECLLVAKIATQTPFNSTNNQKYQVMGDPGTRLSLPELWADVSLEDLSGHPVTQVQRGQTVVFKGRMRDRPTGAPIAFNGVVGMKIEDSAPILSVSPCWTECCQMGTQSFAYTAAPIYQGDVAVTGGQFTGRFVVPLEAAAGSLAKVRGYVSGTGVGQAFETDGVGSTPFAIQPGNPPPNDRSGPTIKLAFPGGATSVHPDAVLRVDLFDESGILTTDHVAQNAIVVTVDDNAQTRVDITPSFRYAANSYQSGTASFPLPNLSAGAHHISVSAADNLALGINSPAHRSTATIDFEVSENPKLSITRTFLFPNPMRSGGSGGGGWFVVDAPGDSFNVLVRIYTVSGRLVRTLQSYGGLGQVQLAWDGLDDAGYPLAIGTYLYRAHVNPRDVDGTSSARQKSDAEGRFVIVAH